jgi:hypothetical protein
MWNHRLIFHRQRLVEMTTSFSHQVQGALDKLQGAGLPENPQGWAYLEDLIRVQSGTMAIEDVFYFCAWLCVIAVPVALFLAKPGKQTSAQSDHAAIHASHL